MRYMTVWYSIGLVMLTLILAFTIYGIAKR